MTANDRIFPWEQTCEELLGPRNILPDLPPEFVAAPLSASRPFGVPRVEVSGVWVEHVDGVGSQVFRTVDSQVVLGRLPVEGVWTIAPELRGSGLATTVSADYHHRYGHTPAELYFNYLRSGLTKGGQITVVRMHTVCVQRAVAEGLPVPAHVLDAVSDTRERMDSLRAGDDSALHLVDDKRTLRKLRCLRGARYTAVKMRQAYLDRLPEGAFKRQLLRLIVVAD